MIKNKTGKMQIQKIGNTKVKGNGEKENNMRKVNASDRDCDKKEKKEKN